MNEELLKAVKSLVNDIENMRYKASDSFGAFNNFDLGGDGTVMIEWPNLAISVDNVKELLDGLVIDGSLAAAPLLSADYATEYEGNE